MADAVGTVGTVDWVLNVVTSKGIQTVNAWIRDFPALMYVGMNLQNMFKDGGTLKRGGLSFADQQSLKFKNIGSLESDMSVTKNEVKWYEVGAFADSALITEANGTADTTVKVDLADLDIFNVGDVVAIRAKSGGTTPNAQAEITGINTGTGQITLDTAVVTAIGDSIMFAYNLITHKAEIDRTVNGTNQTPVTTYFQKFGGSVEFDSQDLNVTRLLTDAQEYVKGKFAVTINLANNTFARTFYLGRNISGTRSETQGLDALITEKGVRDGAANVTIDFTGVTVAKDKAKLLVQTLNSASSAPVYVGGEVPTVYCNYAFIDALSEILYDMGNFYTLKDKEIEFGLTQYSSPYFKNVQFIVDTVLNNLEQYQSVAYVFPKHLVTFKTPEYQSVNENGALVKSSMGGYSVIKMPQTSVDFVKYTAQMTMANVFAGQTFKNTYKKIIGF